MRYLWIILYGIADLFKKPKKDYAGIGKSGILVRHAREQGVKLVKLKTSKLSVDEFKGMPNE